MAARIAMTPAKIRGSTVVRRVVAYRLYLVAGEENRRHLNELLGWAIHAEEVNTIDVTWVDVSEPYDALYAGQAALDAIGRESPRSHHKGLRASLRGQPRRQGRNADPTAPTLHNLGILGFVPHCPACSAPRLLRLISWSSGDSERSHTLQCARV